MPKARPSSSSNLRQKFLLGLLLGIPVVLILFPMEWLTGDETRTLCLYTNLTGHSCYGCGMTRALVSVMHGDFAGAWHYNRLIAAVFPLLAVLWGREVWRLGRAAGFRQRTNE